MALIEVHFEDSVRVVGADDARSVLPVVRTQDHHPANVEPTRRAIRAELGFDAFILGCRQVDIADGVVRRLLDVERIGDLSQDQRSSEVVDGRDWTQPGWFSQATTWLERQAAIRGWTIQAVEQIRSWEFSCVLRVLTDEGELYFKALPETYAAEVPLVQQLAAWQPAQVPEVVAADVRRRWVLLRACRGRCLEDGAPLTVWQRAARAYADLQVASAPRLDRLRALGCPDRSPSALQAAIGPLLADEAAFLVDQAHGLTSAEFERLRACKPWLEAACAELSASPVPLTLEHGDLWASNVYVGDGEPQFIDWTDACLSHPFLSLGPLLRSAGWDAHLQDDSAAVRTIADAYHEGWSTFASPADLRRLLALAEPLAALHIAVTIWSHSPGSHQQWWLWRMVPFFARLALELLPAADVL